MEADDAEIEAERQEVQSQVPDVPDDEDYVTVNDNIPFFTNEDITDTTPYSQPGQLDRLGRVTAANAVLNVDLMPSGQRGNMDSSIHPTGWVQNKYEGLVEGDYLYNRSHLLGYQLTGSENDSSNLMTGTRWFNAEGMLPFENYVANYIEETENTVRYRVTPVFEGDNLLASGVYMEGFSIEDNGEGLCFNIFVPNRQPGITIDYRTGENWESR